MTLRSTDFKSVASTDFAIGARADKHARFRSRRKDRPAARTKKDPAARGLRTGAGNETRTRDPDLGKVVLYQLSYSRISIVVKMEAWVGIEPAYTALQAAA
jgi:hypothetical protein